MLLALSAPPASLNKGQSRPLKLMLNAHKSQNRPHAKHDGAREERQIPYFDRSLKFVHSR